MSKNDFNELQKKVWSALDIMRAAGLNISDSIDHFTYFLYMRLLDDREHLQEKIDPAYRTRLGDDRWRFYNWAQQGTRLPDFIGQELFPHLAQLPDRKNAISMVDDNSDLRTIFSDAVLLLSTPPLFQVLDIVQSLNLDSQNTNAGGDVYEMLLYRAVDEHAELGQFYTQRHLIKLMVNLMDPKLGETVYDPASGTGGFLLSAYEHIHRTLSPLGSDYQGELRKLQHETIYGREKNRRIYMQSITNMILHGDGHSKIISGNSLSPSAQDHNRFDVIFTNPPFGKTSSSEWDIESFPIKTNNLEALFLQHIMASLKPDGRAAMIVSEAILFQSGAVQRIRQQLMKDFSVEAVLSLPVGVFAPYTSVKASILVFKKAGPTKRVWFLDIRVDEPKLPTSRPQSVRLGDLEAIYELWLTKPQTEQTWWADSEKIAQNDYILSASQYLPMHEAGQKYRRVRLEELLLPLKDEIDIFDDTLYQRIEVKSHGEGVIQRDQVYGSQIMSKKQQVVRAGQLLVSAIGAKDGACGVVPQDLDGAIVSKHYQRYEVDSSVALADYIALALNHESIEREIQSYVRGSTGLSSIRARDFLSLNIPLPSIEDQQTFMQTLQTAKTKAEEAMQQYKELRQRIQQEVYNSEESESVQP